MCLFWCCYSLPVFLNNEIQYNLLKKMPLPITELSLKVVMKHWGLGMQILCISGGLKSTLCDWQSQIHLFCVLCRHFTSEFSAGVGRRAGELLRSITRVLKCTEPVWPGMTRGYALKWLNLVPTPPHFSFMSRPNTESEMLLPQLDCLGTSLAILITLILMSEMWSLGQLLQLPVALLVCIVLSLDS